jgi:hypothetical protein
LLVRSFALLAAAACEAGGVIVETRIRLRGALAALLLLFAVAPAPAEPVDPAGRWALHAGDRTLMILDLRRDAGGPGGWAGSLWRPTSIDIVGGSPVAGNYRWPNLRPPIDQRRLVGASADGDSLRLEFDGPPDDRDRVRFRGLPGGTYAELDYNPGRAAPFRLVRAAPGETVATDWHPDRIYAADPEWPSNAEAAAMFVADQAARLNHARIDWAAVAPQDEARRRRIRALLDAGELQSADDFYHAAFIFQHGSSPEDYLLAHTLAMVAIARGRAHASWIAAATLDRYLQEIGRPQIFGTQFQTQPDGAATQEPYSADLVPDALRNALGVPGRAAQEERRRELETPPPAPPHPPQR